MKLIVNGQEREYDAPLTGEGLLSALKISPATVVAELNGEIVRREEFLARELSEGDKLELVTLVGGG